jgi:hypothetical protein
VDPALAARIGGVPVVNNFDDRYPVGGRVTTHNLN